MAYRIYLVDDDRFLLDMYAVKFRTAGHEVTAFAGGKEVLETMRTEKLAESAKVIILSNQGQESDIERAKTLGAAGYIIKASAIPSEVFAETISIIEKKA